MASSRETLDQDIDDEPPLVRELRMIIAEKDTKIREQARYIDELRGAIDALMRPARS